MNTLPMVINISINLTSMILCALGVVYVQMGAKVDSALYRFFMQIAVCLILFGGATMARQLLNGHPGQGIHALLAAACMLEFTFSCLLAYVASRYLLVVARDHRAALRWSLHGLMLLYIVMLLVSQFTGLFYTVSAENQYSRSSGYLLCYLPVWSMILIDIGVLIRCRSSMRSREQIAFWIYLLVPSLSIVLQIFIQGISFGVLASTVAAFCLYLIIVADQTEQYYRQVEENAKLKNEILLAQIQPHFLYNSLGAIKSACRTDPMRARDAIEQFTEYLRHNMDSLTNDKPIAFAEELGHVEHYMNLQKLRFGEELNVRYNLECTDFRLPTLSLQPLVENAVTYGARRQTEHPGIVTIRSREFSDRYEVSVIDNGPGFVPETLPGDSARSHVGLQNVRDRLRQVCGGELRIRSVPGEGTTATIILPKERV